MNNNIVLIGMPGSGKSTVGVVLAKMLGMNFVDVDLIIQQREGALLQTILDQKGTEAFLEIEADAVCSLDCADSVIAPGGSAVLLDREGDHLKQLGTVVYLKIPVEALAARLSNLDNRGVPMKPGQTIADLYRYRQPFYEKYADITVDTAGKSLEDTCSAVLKALIQRT